MNLKEIELEREVCDGIDLRSCQSLYVRSKGVVLLLPDSKETCMEAMVEVSVEKRKLAVKQTTGSIPLNITQYGLGNYDNLVFLFGGENKQEESLYELYLLNLLDYTWYKVFTLEKPEPRQNIRIVVDENGKLIRNDFILLWRL